MFNIFKSVICLFIINAFVFILNVLTSYLATFFCMLCKFFGNTHEEEIKINFILIFFLLVWVVKYFILPISYKRLENSKKFELVAKFIKKLKQSRRLKIFVLLIAYFTSLITDYISIKEDFYIQLLRVMLSGLFGCYIVLFVYWFIEDKIKKFQKKKSN